MQNPIGVADGILHRNCEGTEQLPELLKQHKKQTDRGVLYGEHPFLAL